MSHAFDDRQIRLLRELADRSADDEWPTAVVRKSTRLNRLQMLAGLTVVVTAAGADWALGGRATTPIMVGALLLTTCIIGIAQARGSNDTLTLLAPLGLRLSRRPTVGVGPHGPVSHGELHIAGTRHQRQVFITCTPSGLRDGAFPWWVTTVGSQGPAFASASAREVAARFGIDHDDAGGSTVACTGHSIVVRHRAPTAGSMSYRGAVRWLTMGGYDWGDLWLAEQIADRSRRPACEES